MRHLRKTLLAIIAVLALAAAGCGGSEVDADEVPGNPPALTVPSDTELESGGSDEADADAATDESTDESTDASSDEATDPDTAAEEPSGTGLVPGLTRGPRPDQPGDVFGVLLRFIGEQQRRRTRRPIGGVPVEIQVAFDLPALLL